MADLITNKLQKSHPVCDFCAFSVFLLYFFNMTASITPITKATRKHSKALWETEIVDQSAIPIFSATT